MVLPEKILARKLKKKEQRKLQMLEEKKAKDAEKGIFIFSK